ncbi:MAG: Prevent-host-death family protein [Parcubacteria group bacterium GW2011_GWC2_44_17]|uniref:Uncharacterized protein n=1 Tax=Candidatus Jacksonbacteria bacterium RIFCSPLOWO2_02_FULL_44_20 TaxID=1798460 RepID=A0A1G2A8N5_9BACT|nr:MAG: Prevent-host-death family protein [Parcubacteria group bacterium GW2011_GWC2_44_17]KKT49908.1 MAG: Prevent-host-death family protein [Parcubacteria group bacterium GW2011_GWF2_44_17]OGY70334.1 MAG: hypothetical protein A3C00_01535 [Candidatus Jacksonbacteria bacterium RIFCSPHIGHO2_02_FULL_44_25]OGY72437.1 MAG: hypothetical protein A3H61_05260 [Candidatus Jacksonbacteria bacterium RIFCSPLOWO2_02_FULL_44_20]OGY74543.1 MAG: hypothetical protein A3H07_02615 [Candidatus Jacksonbacteria bacte
MITINTHKAKTHLSHYLSLVQKGTVVIIAKHNLPVAELRPIQKLATHRAVGLCQEKFDIPKSFYKPLPKKIVDAFNKPQ